MDCCKSRTKSRFRSGTLCPAKKKKKAFTTVVHLRIRCDPSDPFWSLPSPPGSPFCSRMATLWIWARCVASTSAWAPGLAATSFLTTIRATVPAQGNLQRRTSMLMSMQPGRPYAPGESPGRTPPAFCCWCCRCCCFKSSRMVRNSVRIEQSHQFPARVFRGLLMVFQKSDTSWIATPFLVFEDKKDG